MTDPSSSVLSVERYPAELPRLLFLLPAGLGRANDPDPRLKALGGPLPFLADLIARGELNLSGSDNVLTLLGTGGLVASSS